jgi:hypothetical protein
VTLRTNPIAVVIKPVPQEGRPADFTGTVGNWSMSASLDRTEAKVGEAITLEIRLFGQGNVKSVGKPRLPQLTGFKVYETVSSSEVQKRENTIKGVKIYRTLLRPEVTGTLSIPVITYSYFNPINSKYEQVKVPPLQLKVLPGEVPEAVPMISAGRQALGAGVRVVAEDIRYLKTSVPVKPEAGPLPPIFWILGFTLPPLFLLCFWGWLRRQDRLLADPRYARRITADRSARLALKKARKACAREDAKDFYSTLAQALTGYLADKLGASRSGVTQREIIRQLHTLGVDPRLMHELTSLFNETDFTRFAPAAYNSLEMKAHLNKAEEILTQLSRVLGKERK